MLTFVKMRVLFQNIFKFCLISRGNTFARCRRHISTQGSLQEKWQLMSAVCLERFPVVTQELNPIEQKWAELMEQLEVEYSYLSDHEMRHIEDKILKERRQQDDYEESEADVGRLYATELEEQWDKDAKAFTPASRTTAADSSGDKTTPERLLDKKLVLVVKEKLGEDQLWCLPQTAWQQGESLRQTAERGLVSLCGDKVKAEFRGNAPCGLYQYKYPSKVQEEAGYTGAKVFFFKAQYKAGDVEVNRQTVTEHLWLSKSELQETVKPSYYHTLNKFIMEL